MKSIRYVVLLGLVLLLASCAGLPAVFPSRAPNPGVERPALGAQPPATATSEVTPTTVVTETAPIEPTSAVTETTGTAPTAEQVMGANPLVGTIWEWAAILKAKPKVQSVVPDPASYTAVFNDDGTMAIKADCNNATATYTLENQNLTIKVGATTRAACPPGSFGETMLAALGNVTAYVIDNGDLILRLGEAGDAMLFRNAGPSGSAGAAAPAPAPTVAATSEAAATGESPAAQPAEATAIAPQLVGPAWLWEQFVDVATGKNSIDVKDPENYTVTFKDDGTVAMKADCNQAAGTYKVDGNQLTIEIGPLTLAACGPNSLGETFLVDLTNAASFSIAEGRLMIDLLADGGRMVFSPK